MANAKVSVALAAAIHMLHARNSKIILTVCIMKKLRISVSFARGHSSQQNLWPDTHLAVK